MKLFLNIIPKNLAESHIASTPIQKLDEIDAIADTIKANMSKEINIPKDVMDSFKLKDTLNPEIWTNGVLNPEVRTKLIKIAQDFFKDLEIPSSVKIQDIIFTGSLANFNWSKFSDIDLHIVLDFNDFKEDAKFVEDYFYAQKSLWNQEHDITVFGYPVELYVQDINADLAATAVYSVLNNKWLLKPKRETFTLDKKAIKDKADKIIYQLRDIRQDYQDKQYQTVVDKIKKLKDKIKAMRKAGLEKGGEFSLENLVFKVLRRTPFMDQLDSYKAKAYDTLMSVSETLDEEETRHLQGGILLLKGAKQEDGTTRLYITAVNKLIGLPRKKADDTEGQAATMAVLGNQVYMVGIVDGRLKAQGIDWKNEGSMLKHLGLTRRDVALNNQKTPLHWETLKFNNLAQALNALSGQILSLPQIKWN